MSSCIYKIFSNQTNKIYIGSTTQKLSYRFNRHKSDYKLQKNKIGAFEVLQFDDAKIEAIEICDNLSNDELRIKERYYYDLYKDDICNIKKPKDTKDERKQYLQEYYKRDDIKNKRNEINKTNRLLKKLNMF